MAISFQIPYELLSEPRVKFLKKRMKLNGIGALFVAYQCLRKGNGIFPLDSIMMEAEGNKVILMHLASETCCCIICVLHQNKAAEDKNLRGFLGTELKNKAFEAYECSKDENRIFTFHQTDTRKYEIIDKLYYTVYGQGIPRLANLSFSPIIPMQTAPASARIYRETAMKAFRDAFRPNERTKAYKALMATVMNILKLSNASGYRRMFNDALNANIIRETEKNIFELAVGG